MRPNGRLVQGLAWFSALSVAGWGGWQVWRSATIPSGGPPPLPAAAASGPSPVTPRTSASALARSAPVRLVVKSIGLVARVGQVGLARDGTVQVPSWSHPTDTAWYRLGPSPGEPGPAVILGHVDSRDNVAVFFRLSQVRPGDQAVITRADGKVVTFTVDRLAEFPKTAFPSSEVYGPTRRPELRLITCGGRFNRRTGEYVDNIVVFAHLTGQT